MRRITRWTTAWLLAGLLALQTACAPSDIPATGGQARTVISPEEELRIGREQHPQVLAEFGGAYDQHRVAAYVEGIGRRLVRETETPGADFTFTVINSEIVNAFALPGGYVYVTRGLIALAENEAELAGVIAHEIGHVTARHAAQRVTRATWAQLGVLGGAVLGGILGGSAGAEIGAQLGGAGGMAYVQGYSREQEFEADQLGVRYLARAGYEPRAMAGFLQALAANDRLQRQLAGRGEGETTPSWLASHPRTVDRVERAAAEAAGAMAGAREVGREPFLRAIDGMIFGDDPKQGVIRGQRFLHPELRFGFEVPQGFRLVNQPTQVLARGPSGRGIVLDTARVAQNVAMDRYLAGDWAREANVQNLRRIRVNGMEAAVGRVRGQVDGRPAELELAAIRFDRDRVYRMFYLAPGGMTRTDVQNFGATLDSFRALSSREASAIRPLRIRVVEVRRGDTVESLSRRMAVETLPREWFLLLNGLAPNDRLEPGRMVKLVVED
jgi:predicted Zn-dependent protease